MVNWLFRDKKNAQFACVTQMSLPKRHSDENFTVSASLAARFEKHDHRWQHGLRYLKKNEMLKKKPRFFLHFEIDFFTEFKLQGRHLVFGAPKGVPGKILQGRHIAIYRAVNGRERT